MRKPKREANTFLTHLLSRGLADERYEVRRYKSSGGGEVQAPARGGEGRAQEQARDRLAPCRPRDAARARRTHRLHGAQGPRQRASAVGRAPRVGQDAVPVSLPCKRREGRPAGTAPVRRIPSNTGRETGCLTGTRREDELTSANATGSGWRNAARGGLASNARQEILPHGIEVSARPVSKEAVPPNAPATPGAKARGARYGGRNPDSRRRMARERNRNRRRERQGGGPLHQLRKSSSARRRRRLRDLPR